ncbi:AraC family transcriptional regulator [Nonomuraea sp. LPB2021202275-12-8]|uniref:AraC family transcriptional regulator n=1 Tax=Nonomuraea sp. LPB2021202275-12-8 TaxID=3120159 RepID=UPI00300C5819
MLSDVLTAMRGGRPHAARTRARAPWGVRFPPGDGAGCHVILQGSCWLMPANGTPQALNVGDVVFLPGVTGYALADHPDSPVVEFRPRPDDGDAPLDQVRIDGAGPTATLLCAAYYFDHDRTHPLLDELPEIIRLPAEVGRHTSLRATVELLGRELATPQAGTTAILTSLIDMLLLFILRAWLDEQAARTPTGWAAIFNDPAMMSALRAIHTHPERSWTVEELAALAGMSRATFAKRFATLAGRPPLTYLTWWRMTTAARLLREGDAPLRGIAEQTGYTSEFAFAKAFKRQYGQAPGQYRRQTPGTDGQERPRPDRGSAYLLTSSSR